MNAARVRGFVLLPVVLLITLLATVAYLGNRESALAVATAGAAGDQDKARYAAEAGLARAIVQMHTKGCSGSYPILLFAPVQDTAFDGGKYYAYAFPLSGSPVSITSTGTYGDATVTLTRTNVPMHQGTPVTLTLQPDATGIDTHLRDTGSTSYGSAASLLASTGTAYPLLRFDLSAIPAGAHVTSATLSTYATAGSGSGAVALHAVQRDWTESATWTSADGSTAWSQPGGDVHASPVASVAFSGSSGSWLGWDVTALADRWVKGSLPNQGVQLRAGASISGLQLTSSDGTTAAQRPTLAVTFLPPCGWVPPSTTLTLAPLADTDIDQPLQNFNFGLDPQLYLSKANEARPLIRFDTASIAAGKVVESARLRLYFEALASGTKTGQALNLSAHKLTKSWDETAATWRQRLSGTQWSLQGGDYTSTAVTTKTLPINSTPGQWVEFELKSAVQEWVDGVTVNNGVLLRVTTSSSDELIFSSNQAATNRPQLVVTYH